MRKYARADTHYLLFVYDEMKNELLAKGNPATKNLLRFVLDRGVELCGQVYEKPIFTPRAHAELAERRMRARGAASPGGGAMVFTDGFVPSRAPELRGRLLLARAWDDV